jgi:drug/metabolite transporter (DMT)-like permease
MSMPGALVILVPYGWSAMVQTNFSAITPYAWLMFAQVAVMSGVVAFACFYTGIKQVGAAQATMYQFFVPPFAALSAWWVLGKVLLPLQMFGMIVVLGGVLYASWARMSRTDALVVASEGSGARR